MDAQVPLLELCLLIEPAAVKDLGLDATELARLVAKGFGGACFLLSLLFMVIHTVAMAFPP